MRNGILSRRLLINVESTSYFRLLVSISVLGGREERAGVVGCGLGSIFLGGRMLGGWGYSECSLGLLKNCLMWG